MADAKKCDICHKYYDRYEDVTVDDNVLSGSRLQFATSGGLCAWKSYDLCKECMSKVHMLLIDISRKAMEESEDA